MNQKENRCCVRFVLKAFQFCLLHALIGIFWKNIVLHENEM